MRAFIVEHPDAYMLVEHGTLGKVVIEFVE
jgi:hypothetical protein